MENGREVKRTEHLPVRPGQMALVNFRQRGDQNAPRSTEMEQRDRRLRTGTHNDQENGQEIDRSRGKPRQLENPNQTNAPEQSRTNRRHTEGSSPFVGKVVSVTDDQVTVSDAQGRNEHTFRIPASADVTVQGKKSSLNSLKPGMQVTITPESDNTGVASKIEAKSGTQEKSGTQNTSTHQGTPREQGSSSSKPRR